MKVVQYGRLRSYLRKEQAPSIFPGMSFKYEDIVLRISVAIDIPVCMYVTDR